MATTHVFIVNANTFKYHLEYQFAGTGAGEDRVDFLQNPIQFFNGGKEKKLVGMIADSQRVRVGDFVIFYLQQNFDEKIYEGKFYGVFKVREAPSFLDDNDGNQFLKDQLGKSLTFRTLIEPYQVYAEGVTEWEALDEIGNIQSPYQMLWSLIYRKLKGNRGNTMITIAESDRLVNLIRNKNQGTTLAGNNFTFNPDDQKIETSNAIQRYTGRQNAIDILPRMIYKHNRGNQFEVHLQAYLMQNIDNLPVFASYNIEWRGNEVSCGVGMQRIDIMLSVNDNGRRKIVPIELKSMEAYPNITYQIQRYIKWLKLYYLPNCPSEIEPMIIARKIGNKQSAEYANFIDTLKGFNNQNQLQLRYIEFEIVNNNINFNEVIY